MFDFVLALFSGVGIAAVAFGVCSTISDLTTKHKKATKERDERITKMIAAIERIEANTRSNPDHG